VDVLDGWNCGSMVSWMIMWRVIMNILQIAKDIWCCEQLQKNLYRPGTFILYPGV